MTGVITRHRVAMYMHGSGDTNPIHVDSDYAREQAGLPDCIVHGMYSMGLFGRLLACWGGPGSVRSIETRFSAMLPVKESLDCQGVVEAVEPAPGGSLVRVKLTATKSDGQLIASGQAQVFLAAKG
jgi:acyl dehydratase